MRHASNIIIALELAKLTIDNINATMKNKLREAKSNPKMFTYIRTKKKAKNNIGPLKMEGNVLTQDTQHMVKILNKSLASVFENTRSLVKCTLKII